MPSRWTGTTGRPVRDGQVGGTAAELLGPAVGGAAALGEDDQVPVVGQQLGGQVGGAAVDLGALDGDGGQQERPGVGLPAPVEEVVGRRRHHRPVAEPQREAAQQQGGVDVAGVVGGEDHRAPRGRRAPRRRGSAVRPRSGPAAGSRCRGPWPGPGAPGTGATRRCRSATPELGLGRRPGDRLGPGRGGQGEPGPPEPRGQGRRRQPAEGTAAEVVAGAAPEGRVGGDRPPAGRRELDVTLPRRSLHVGHQDGRGVEVGQRRGGADHVLGHLQRVGQGGRRPEPEAVDGGLVAARRR